MSGASGNTGKPPYTRDCNRKFLPCQGINNCNSFVQDDFARAFEFPLVADEFKSCRPLDANF